RGGSVDMLEVRADALSVVHASDVGQSPPAQLIERLEGPDVLLVPCGGFYTIGAAQAWEWVRRLRPKVIVPIHYKTRWCHLPLRDETVFRGYASAIGRIDARSEVVEMPDLFGALDLDHTSTAPVVQCR
ncbi:MAG: MBL fold metallo-hydrolase, partial [Myxococcota bacterium]